MVAYECQIDIQQLNESYAEISYSNSEFSTGNNVRRLTMICFTLIWMLSFENEIIMNGNTDIRREITQEKSEQ